MQFSNINVKKTKHNNILKAPNPCNLNGIFYRLEVNVSSQYPHR